MEPGHVGALGEVGGGGFDLLEAKLVGNAVLIEDVGNALYFTCRRSEKGDPIAGFYERAGFGNGHLHVAVESLRRARRDVERLWHAFGLGISWGRPTDLEFLEGELGEGARGALDFLPTEVYAIGVVGWGTVDLI